MKFLLSPLSMGLSPPPIKCIDYPNMLLVYCTYIYATRGSLTFLLIFTDLAIVGASIAGNMRSTGVKATFFHILVLNEGNPYLNSMIVFQILISFYPAWSLRSVCENFEYDWAAVKFLPCCDT